MDDVATIAKAYLEGDTPVPLDPTHETGDGDFREIGAEFLSYLVSVGKLSPTDNVLELGCGFGRMALPLTQYLDQNARYLGFDVVPEPVDWCLENVAPRHQGFEFDVIDFHHSLYNPRGKVKSEDGFSSHLQGLEDLAPTFVMAVSVFTHLDIATVRRFLREARLLLQPGGRLFMTAFLTGKWTPPKTDRMAFPGEAWVEDGPLTGLLGTPKLAAAGISWRWLSEELDQLGFSWDRPIFGHWRQGHIAHRSFQDLLVCNVTDDPKVDLSPEPSRV